MARVMIFGTFDGLHPGHQFVIDSALARGSVVVVVAQDITVERIKGSTPVHSQADRIAKIKEQYPEMTVVLGEKDNYVDVIHSYKPDLLLFGYDQQLPPGVTTEDITVPTERLPAFEPERWKSSKLRIENRE